MINHLNLRKQNRLPVIFQTEAAECGLACMVMIARFYGHNVDLAGLRQNYSTSLKGITLDGLIEIAAKLDLGSRALRLEIDELQKLQTPAILHWDLNHFVVLKNVSGKKIYIHDPEKGANVLSINEFSDHFTGVALELTPSPSFSVQVAREKMRLSQLWGKLVGLKRAIFQIFFLSIILQVIVLASPFYLQLVVDEAIVKYDKSLLLVLAFGFGGLAVIRVATMMMREWAILHFGYQMSFQMVANLFRHLIHLPVTFFEKRHIGDILSRMRSTTPIQNALTKSLVTAIIDGFMAVITGIVIFVYSPLLGLIVMCSVIILLIVTFGFYPVLRRTQEEKIIKEAIENTHRMESIRASTPIKLFSAQNQRVSIWRNLYADYINSAMVYGKYDILQRGMQTLIEGLQVILIIYFGAKLILNGGGTFSIGMLFAIMAYRQNFTKSVISLFNKFVEFRLLGLHLERIADIALSVAEDKHLPVVQENNTTAVGRIQVKNLSFRYSPADQWVFKNRSFVIESGSFVVLHGPSGGGKTTMLKLLVGLYQPSSGEIIVDGTPLTDSKRLSWRQHIGVVMQEDRLLSGSVADNISFFDQNIDMARIIKVSKMAHIHAEILAMPMKYQSLIGDMGSTLSGGQKQRVILARALYKNPKILFLDEGTANLDVKTEQSIVDVIAGLKITRVIVAHRPEFINRADYTIEIE